MEELVMFIVKVGIGLPRLPPLGFKIDAWVVNDSMIVDVYGDAIEWHWKQKKMLFM